MYKYLIAFVLLTPLAGILLVEGGEYATSVGVDGHRNGAGVAFLAYAMTVTLVAVIFTRRRLAAPPVAQLTSDAAASFRNFSAVLLLFNCTFLAIFLFGFGAINVWLGSIGKGEFRATLGSLGAFPNLMTRFIVPALFAYATVLYSRTSRRGTLKLWWFSNLFVVFIIGASWGFKSGAMLGLLPALLLLHWRIRLRTLLKLGAAFAATVTVFFMIFDAGVEDADVLSFLLRRITVLQGDSAWHMWGLYASGEEFPSYWPTLIAAVGDKTLGLFGLSRDDSYEWMLYHYDWMLTYLTGSQLDKIAEGHSVVATPFAEGLVAGGVAGVAVFAVLAGLLVRWMYRFIERALTRRQDVRATMGATYFCSAVFPWLNGGAIVQLFHISLLISITTTFLVLFVLSRIRTLAPYRPPLLVVGPAAVST